MKNKIHYFQVTICNHGFKKHVLAVNIKYINLSSHDIQFCNKEDTAGITLILKKIKFGIKKIILLFSFAICLQKRFLIKYSELMLRMAITEIVMSFQIAIM